MIIQYVSEETRQDPALVFTTPCTVQCLKYQEGRLFAGLVDGTLAVYVRDIGKLLMLLYQWPLLCQICVCRVTPLE